MADIAAAKAGIIKPGCPVVSYGGAPGSRRRAAPGGAQQNAPLPSVDLPSCRSPAGIWTQLPSALTGWMGCACRSSAAISPATPRWLLPPCGAAAAGGWNIPNAIPHRLEQVSWPRRFELLRHSPAFVLDGGPQCPRDARHGAEPERPASQARNSVFLVSIMADKDVDDTGAAGTAGRAVRDRDGAQPPRHACADAGRAYPRLRLHRQKLRTASKAGVARAEELGGGGRYAHWAL